MGVANLVTEGRPRAPPQPIDKWIAIPKRERYSLSRFLFEKSFTKAIAILCTTLYNYHILKQAHVKGLMKLSILF